MAARLATFYPGFELLGMYSGEGEQKRPLDATAVAEKNITLHLNYYKALLL